MKTHASEEDSSRCNSDVFSHWLRQSCPVFVVMAIRQSGKWHKVGPWLNLFDMRYTLSDWRELSARLTMPSLYPMETSSIRLALIIFNFVVSISSFFFLSSSHTESLPRARWFEMRLEEWTRPSDFMTLCKTLILVYQVCRADGVNKGDILPVCDGVHPLHSVQSMIVELQPKLVTLYSI
jgi:hypothetical protein